MLSYYLTLYLVLKYIDIRVCIGDNIKCKLKAENVDNKS